MVFLCLSSSIFFLLFSLALPSLTTRPCCSLFSSHYYPFTLPCPVLASLSISLVILLYTHYFSWANWFPRMEGTAYLLERNFAPLSCSGQISRQLLIQQDLVGRGPTWNKLSTRNEATWCSSREPQPELNGFGWNKHFGDAQMCWLELFILSQVSLWLLLNAFLMDLQWELNKCCVISPNLENINFLQQQLFKKYPPCLVAIHLGCPNTICWTVAHNSIWYIFKTSWSTGYFKKGKLISNYSFRLAIQQTYN